MKDSEEISEGIVLTKELKLRNEIVGAYLGYLRRFHKGDGDVIYADFKTKKRFESKEAAEEYYFRRKNAHDHT